MNDAAPQAGSEPETGNGSHAGRPGVPRWVKVSGVVVALLVLMLVAIMLIGGGEHGPTRHASGQSTGQVTHTAPVDEPSGPERTGA